MNRRNRVQDAGTIRRRCRPRRKTLRPRPEHVFVPPTATSTSTTSLTFCGFPTTATSVGIVVLAFVLGVVDSRGPGHSFGSGS